MVDNTYESRNNQNTIRVLFFKSSATRFGKPDREGSDFGGASRRIAHSQASIDGAARLFPCAAVYPVHLPRPITSNDEAGVQCSKAFLKV
jgi:hypothetical protein